MYNWISKEEYHERYSKFMLNVIPIDHLTIYDIFKVEDIKVWNGHICHGGHCNADYNHALFLLINKKKIFSLMKQNPSQYPEDKLNPFLINKEDSLTLQNLVLKTNFKKFLNDISHPSNLLSIGIVLNMVREIERENKILTRFFTEKFKEVYHKSTIESKKLDNIYFNGNHMTYDDLEIVEAMSKEHESRIKFRRQIY